MATTSHSEPDQQRKVRRPWVLVLLVGPMVIFLLLAGMVAWSWDHRIALDLGGVGGRVRILVGSLDTRLL